MLFGVCWNHFQTKTLRGINDVHVLCSWARQLRQIFTAFPEKFGGPDARGERCELLGGQQLWYLGIDRLVQVPDFVFFLEFVFLGVCHLQVLFSLMIILLHLVFLQVFEAPMVLLSVF